MSADTNPLASILQVHFESGASTHCVRSTVIVDSDAREVKLYRSNGNWNVYRLRQVNFHEVHLGEHLRVDWSA